MEHITNNMNKTAMDYDLSSIHKINILEADVNKLLMKLNMKSVDHHSSSCSSAVMTESFCISDHSGDKEKASHE